MRVYDYRPDKAAMGSAFLAAFAYASYALWKPSGSVIVLIFGLMMAAGAAKLAYDAFNRTPVIKFDRNSLWVRKTMGAVAEIPWREVHSIKLMVFTMKYAGLIPVGKHQYLEIACEGGMFGTQRFRVSTETMRLPAGGAQEVALILQAAHVEAVGVAGVAMAGAGKRGWGVDPSPAEQPVSGFDADAALARYLASKEAKEQQQAPSPEPARMGIPQRPVFGRKTS
jgi:hypothetical protein